MCLKPQTAHNECYVRVWYHFTIVITDTRNPPRSDLCQVKMKSETEVSMGVSWLRLDMLSIN